MNLRKKMNGRNCIVASAMKLVESFTASFLSVSMQQLNIIERVQYFFVSSKGKISGREFFNRALPTTVRLGDVAAFENRQPVTATKFINKSSLFTLLLGVIRRLELKLNSEHKVENIFVAPPYSQAACCAFAFILVR